MSYHFYRHLKDISIDPDSNYNEENKTPLHQSIINTDLDKFNLLLELGEDVNAKDIYDKTPLDYALLLCSLQYDERIDIIIVQLIKAGAITTSSNDELIHKLVMHDRHKTLQIIINSGIDYNFIDKNGKHAIHYATIYGQSRCLKILLESKVDVNLKDSFGRTPFFIAIEELCEEENRHYHECITYLLNYNADINIGDNEGITPLMLTIIHKKNNIRRYLIDADYSIKDKYGTSAFDLINEN